MSRRHDDKEMIIASQIAYLDFDNEAVSTGKYTIGELLDTVTDEEKKKNFQDLIRDYPEVNSWKIRDIRNNQQSSGMYACLIETEDNEAIIAFRGSESDTPGNVIRDWGLSDFGLVNNTLTPQQLTAQMYMRDIYERYGDEYSSFDVTGHSLGGNLAEHATITALDGMRGKIRRCVNLDGPGFSTEYIAAHASDINKIRDNIDHYQWSVVGSLLIPIPGSNYQTVVAETPENKESELGNMLWRHDTKNVKYDNGNFISGKRDWLAIALSAVAFNIDLSIFWVCKEANLLEALIFHSFDQFLDQFRKTWEKWQDIRYSHMDAQFEIRPSIVERNTDELWDVEKKLNTICAEVQEIQGKLAFNSVSAGCLKMKLWTISNGIENDNRKLTNYAKAGRECCEHYRYNENNIADMYAS